MRFAIFISLSAAGFAQTCPAPTPLNNNSVTQKPGWNGWGAGTSNARFQSARAAGLTAAEIPKLQLKWAFGFPGARAVLSQPTVVDGHVFIGVDTGNVYALNANSGCQYWAYKADAGVRTALSVGLSGRTMQAYLGDLKANVYALDANTGKELWKVKVEDHPAARITGAPQLFEGKLYVAVASGEEGAAANPKYECCTFRGSVVALDASSGKRLWKTYVIEREPKPTRKTSSGVQMWAPSGAGIWSPPTIDARRRALYVGTGDAYSEPADGATDAIVALSMDTGKILWVAQDTANDAWLAGCGGANQREQCPKDLGPDHDFGSPPMLKRLSNGKDALIAGQKSGNVWAHDPDNRGAVLWRTALVSNTTEFGGKIIWGGASDELTGYFGLGPGGIGAVQLRDGERKWFAAIKPVAGRETHPGHDGPLTVIPGVVFSGGWDGILRALSTADGKLLWEYDTAKEMPTVNGVPGKGGSMGAAGSVVAAGKLFVPSGYIGVKNGLPGNVLLMFSK